LQELGEKKGREKSEGKKKNGETQKTASGAQNRACRMPPQSACRSRGIKDGKNKKKNKKKNSVQRPGEGGSDGAGAELQL
jgi:hypothetical protein